MRSEAIHEPLPSARARIAEAGKRKRLQSCSTVTRMPNAAVNPERASSRASVERLVGPDPQTAKYSGILRMLTYVPQRFACAQPT